MLFDSRGASRERVIGLSFVDILIQFLFVIFIAYLVILDEKKGSEEHAQIGKDFCVKVRKDSPLACREVIDKFVPPGPKSKDDTASIGPWPDWVKVCKEANISDPEDCIAKINESLALMPMAYCLEPRNKDKTLATLSVRWRVEDNDSAVLVEFSKEYRRYLESRNDVGRLDKVAELEKKKLMRFSATEIMDAVKFMVQPDCAHMPGISRPAAYTDDEIRPLTEAIYSIRRTSK